MHHRIGLHTVLYKTCAVPLQLTGIYALGILSGQIQQSWMWTSEKHHKPYLQEEDLRRQEEELRKAEEAVAAAAAAEEEASSEESEDTNWEDMDLDAVKLPGQKEEALPAEAPKRTAEAADTVCPASF